MRVLLVNSHGNDLSVGGAERAVDLLHQGLAARGHSVSLLSAFPGAPTDDEQDVTVLHDTDWRKSELVRIKNHAEDWLSLPRRELARAVAAHAPDIVHTHNLPGIGTGIWEVCRRQQIPVVHTLHDYYLLCPRVTLMQRDGTTPCSPHALLCGRRTHRITRWSGAVSALIAVSQHVLDRHSRLFPASDRLVVRLPMSTPQWPNMRPPGKTLHTVGYIGNLDPIKGVKPLLQAVPALAALGVEVRIAGHGRMVDEVVATASRHPTIHFHGRVGGKAKEDFFEACDVGIIPSVWAEPGGPQYTMIEWLSSGRPILVSERGGLGEVVNGYGGATAIEPSCDGIVAAIRRLSSDAAWKSELAQLRPVIADTFDQWIETHESIYGAARPVARAL